MYYFSDSVGLYFYSAVFQGNMAILALIGVFVVFKLQQLSTQLQQKEVVITNYVQGRIGTVAKVKIPISYSDISNLEVQLKKLAEGDGSVNYNDTIRQRTQEILSEDDFKNRISEYESISNNLKQIKISWKYPFLSILAVIILALIFLASAYWIHVCFPLVEIIIIYTTIIMNILALIINARFIFKIVTI